MIRLIQSSVGNDDYDQPADGAARSFGASAAEIGRSNDCEEDLVDLLRRMTSKFRQYPALLMIFFRDTEWIQPATPTALSTDLPDPDGGQAEGNGDDSSSDARLSSPTPSSASTIRRKRDYDFLIFGYLLRFVHREGLTGDYAREGLLSLVSLAADIYAVDTRAALAEYILDGDFADVLGAGLGAVYGALPQKLFVRPPAVNANADTESGSDSMGMQLGGTVTEGDPEGRLREGVEVERLKARGVEISTNPDFQAQLQIFAKLLEFTQDVLLAGQGGGEEECDGLMLALKASVLDSIRSSFLEK